VKSPLTPFPLQNGIGPETTIMDSDTSQSAFRLTYTAAAARRLLWILLSVEVLLTAAYILTRIIAPATPWGALRGFFNVDQEVSIPTWFSAAQLFALAIVVLSQAAEAAELRTLLIVIGCAFLFLSMDEAAAVHDSFFKAAQNAKIPWLKGVEYLAWMVPYTVAAVIGLLIGLRPALIMWCRFRRETLCIALGAAIFVGGGMGMEMVTHVLYMIAVNARFYLAVAAEEFFEMAGVSVMLYGFLLLGLRLQPDTLGRAETI
jgi:hypothetical protein